MKTLNIKRGQSPIDEKITAEQGIADWARRLFSSCASERAAEGIDARFDRADELIDGDLYGGLYCDDQEMSPYFNIVAAKFRDYMAAVTDLQYQIRDKGWTISASPKQTVPHRVMRSTAERIYNQVIPVYREYLTQNNLDPQSQEALSVLDKLMSEYKGEMQSQIQRAAEAGIQDLDKEIHDQLTESGFSTVRDDIYASMGMYPYAVLKGPFLEWGPMNHWEEDILQFGEKQRISAKEVDGRLFWMTPDSRGTQDGKATIEAVPIGISDLIKMKRKGDSFNSKSINKIISNFKSLSNYKWWTTAVDKSALMNDPLHIHSAPFVNRMEKNGQTLGLLIYGNWTGIELKQIGFSSKNLNEEEDYQLELLVLGEYVLSARVNVYPDKRRPYHISAFSQGKSWRNHKGIPDILEGLQRSLQNSYEDLQNASYSASNPIREVDLSKFDVHDVPEAVEPGSTLYITNNGINQNTPAVRTYLEASNLQAIMANFATLKNEASTLTGINDRLVGASTSPSENRTGAVYSGAVSGSLKIIRAITLNFDKALAPMIKMTVNWIMAYSKKDQLKWDTDVIATGSEGVIEREQFRNDLGIVMQTVMLATREKIIPVEAYQAILYKQMQEYGVDLEGLLPNPLAAASLSSALPSQTQQPLTEGVQLDGRSPEVPTGQIKQSGL